MTCYLCGSGDYLKILRKGDAYVWTDTSDDESIRTRYRCNLNQCNNCGHVYQPVNDDLRNLFAQIYLSRNAQGPSSMGVGRWGTERAHSLFFNAIDLAGYKTAIEIGCGNGYLLKCLKDRGFERLVGIEPSVNVDKDVDGITFINDFLDGHLILDEKVDLIFSIAVFEHIENINAVLSFCRNNIRKDGELFFVVPNAQQQLENGDPALFVHQHVHYFTEHSIRYLLLQSGFDVNSIVSRKESFNVSARLGNFPSRVQANQPMFYERYQAKLGERLTDIQSLLSRKTVLVHGACNAMNNIACWIEGDYDLVDNDENKQGKRYFDKTVLSPRDVDLERYDTVLVIPDAYFEQIKAEYVRKGFRGSIVNGAM